MLRCYLILNFSTDCSIYLYPRSAFYRDGASHCICRGDHGSVPVCDHVVGWLSDCSQSGAMRWQSPMAISSVGSSGRIGIPGHYQGQRLPGSGKSPAGFGTPEQIGNYLFKPIPLPFEITSVLLLAAMVGAIVLTLKETEKVKDINDTFRYLTLREGRMVPSLIIISVFQQSYLSSARWVSWFAGMPS